MESIPINFEHKGKHYNCKLSNVSGAGCYMFHLNDGRFYLGRLRWSDYEKGWVFDPNPKDPELAELADFFGDVVAGWYE
jgi:hypothetical protein